MSGIAVNLHLANINQDGGGEVGRVIVKDHVIATGCVMKIGHGIGIAGEVDLVTAKQ